MLLGKGFKLYLLIVLLGTLSWGDGFVIKIPIGLETPVYRECEENTYDKRRMLSTPRKDVSMKLLRDTLMQDNPYFLTRIILLRALAFVYGTAFLVSKHQSKALIGDYGITPARNILNEAEERGKLTQVRRKKWIDSGMGDKATQSQSTVLNPLLFVKSIPVIRRIGMALKRNSKFQYWRERLWDRKDRRGHPVTTLLWLANDRTKLDAWLDHIANWGLIMSLLVFVLGAANVPLMVGLWICQRSLMAVGGTFWGYGWEPQLAELGFHAIFLVPFFSLRQICVVSPPSKLVLFTIKWHLFRIMMGAGLIKLKSQDIKWKWPNLSAMFYFYETQPVPNPMSKVFHSAPVLWHKFEVLVNHFVELIVPWGLLLPFTKIRRLSGLLQIFFQAVLISSGNLSFLNWLTAVPAITCLDDTILRGFFPNSWRQLAFDASKNSRITVARLAFDIFFVTMIGYLSIPVVKNLLSRRQLMNSSFGPLRLVNTYGAFGNVDENREEFIVVAASHPDGPWREYDFKVKPGNIWRAPRFISPYHYRLDWQIWIASTIGHLEYSPWIYTFLLKLLQQDPGVIGLIDSDPFVEADLPPKYIRIDKYRYTFDKSGKAKGGQRPYWNREFLGQVFPKQGAATASTLQEIIQS